MTAKNDQKIISIIDNKTTAIEIIDNDIMMETVGVDMALDKLRGALDMMETHMNEREFEKASRVGYQEVAHNLFMCKELWQGFKQPHTRRKRSLVTSHEKLTPPMKM
ncbi:MAG: hypothetical protein WC856_21955 [Methylococcaceae bacterium]|jgi:hypothetical protein